MLLAVRLDRVVIRFLKLIFLQYIGGAGYCYGVCFGNHATSLLGGLMRTHRQVEFVPAKTHAKITTGEVVRTLRELKGWTQTELGRRSGISATNISLIENEKVEIGKKRVEQLAKAFNIHPAIIMFPEYEAKEIQKAA